jgi:hypothetical protein
MTAPQHVRIALVGQAPDRRIRLLETLESLMPLRFGGQPAAAALQADGEMIFGRDPRSTAGSAMPSLQLPAATAQPAGGTPVLLTVHFGDQAAVPFPFRGRTLSARVAGSPAPLQGRWDEQILARTDQGPVWTVSHATGQPAFRSAFSIVAMAADESFCHVFGSDRFVENLPLIEFLRCVSGDRMAQPPPLRATFMFDDPNLHRPTYGHVHFARIAQQAREFNYHVAFATIPLDGWYAHRATAELFHRHADKLSLLIHGNDHLKHEMARDQTDAERVRMLHQAIARIERLERATGLDVCRAMVPPHGACSSAMLAMLPPCGFESACISAGSLIAHNPGHAWRRTLGFFPAESIEGCAVLPRAALTGNVQNTILVNAYLGQPIILRGHHNDLQDGLQRLEQLASMINGLGKVTWANMTMLGRMSYLSRMHQGVCHVTPLNERVTFELPTAARQLVIEHRDGDAPAAQSARYVVLHGGRQLLATTGRPVVIDPQAPGPLEVQRQVEPRAMAAAAPARVRLGPVLRRILTEGRDRLALN